MSRRAFFGLELCLLLFVSGLTRTSRSPGLRWSGFRSCNNNAKFTYNGASCSWSLKGNDVSGVDLTVQCDEGVVGAITQDSVLWEDDKECSALITTVTMTNINAINSGRFKGSEMLKTLTLTECQSLTNIADSLCEGCGKLTEVFLPGGVTDIGASAFSGCSSLKSANFDMLENLQSIGNKAFFGCSSLDLVFGDQNTLTSVGASAFEGSGVSSFGAAPQAQLGDRTFASCKSLTLAILPTMTEVPAGLFDGCSKLTTIGNFPTAPTSIGARALAGCERLQEFGLKLTSNSLSSIGESAFAGSGYQF